MPSSRTAIPAAMACLEKDLEECVTYLRFRTRIIAAFGRRIGSTV